MRIKLVTIAFAFACISQSAWAQLEPFADFDTSKEEYATFMKARGDANQKRTREITKNYPSMREITGEYLVREITIK